MTVVSGIVALAGCDDAFGLDRRIEPCPATYAPIGISDSSYRFVDARRDWVGAHDTCRGESATGVTHLAVFENTAEIAAVQDAFPLMFETHVGYGRRLDGNPDVFRAVTGELLVRGSPLWFVGEPNNDLAPELPESIVIIRETERLADAPASFAGEFVCECDGIETPVVFEPPP